MTTPIKKSWSLGAQTVQLEYGEIGRQAAASVLVNIDDTVVMVNVTGRREAVPNATFLPLSVDYQEKLYACGKIPGGFFRREGRPTEKETLTARLVDRSLRPLFPDFYYNEVQVVASVLSYNPEVDSDIPAMIGASAALSISGIPFGGPVGAARVGYVDGQIIVSPTASQLEESSLNLVVAGTKDGVLMVESEANELPEDTMLAAVMAGFTEMQKTIAEINDLRTTIALPRWEWEPPQLDDATKKQIDSLARERLVAAYALTDKQERQQTLQTVRDETIAEVSDDDTSALDKNMISSLLKKIEADIVRNEILSGKPRIDGRSTRDVRPVTCRTGVLPRTHGSALFTRGETQALVVATLGSERDNQRIETLNGDIYSHFMLHYNFPPYATGETGRVGTPKRREIGHGRLAKRGLLAVMPTIEDFGFSVRVVSEITESNGSSSMASVCGGSLALMDAGVPVKSAVSGIAMGLIKEDNRYAVLSDILGDEDHLGDMDFKVAGTANGVTALQMDLKIDSINEEIMQAALQQAHEGRMQILGVMNQALDAPRQEVSQYAPRILKMKIHTDKIRDVIGKGGSVIRSITETSGARVDVNDDGVITISGDNLTKCQSAEEMINNIIMDLEVGGVYKGRVEKILDNVGAIVNIRPGKDGLVHISQITHAHVKKVSDYLSVGQEVQVKVMQLDEGKVRLSIRALLDAPAKDEDGEQ